MFKGESMVTRYAAILLTSLCINSAAYGQKNVSERTDWGEYFNKFNAKGTIAVLDGREKPGKAWVYDNGRANRRYSPASTFKLPHTLFALDAGAVKDEFEVFPWDGVKRAYSLHNQDQNLRSAMRNSAIWVYEIFAKEIGERKAQRYLNKIHYGNEDPSTENGTYWVDGNLAISAYEQVAFLRKLYQNKLPFSSAHQLLLKDLMITEAGPDWILRAKTGWEGHYGWWIGWVEWPTGPVFFALNIDTPHRWKDLYKREAIAREVLQSIQALPPDR